MIEQPKKPTSKKPPHPDRFFLNSVGLWMEKSTGKLIRVYSLQPWRENRKKYVEAGYLGNGCLGPFFQITTTKLSQRAVYLEKPYFNKETRVWVDKAKLEVPAGTTRTSTPLVQRREQW